MQSEQLQRLEEQFLLTRLSCDIEVRLVHGDDLLGLLLQEELRFLLASSVL